MYTKSYPERIDPSVYRAGRKMIYRRSRDTFTDTARQTETDDVSQDWRWFKYLLPESQNPSLDPPPFLAPPIRKEWDFFLRPVSQPPPPTTPLRSFKGILSPGHAASQYRIVTMNHWNLHSTAFRFSGVGLKNSEGHGDIN